MRFPHEIILEKNALEKIPDVVDGSALIVTSPTAKKVAGNYVSEILDSEIVIIKESGFNAVEESRKKATDFNVDFLIGVGGGVPIDTAKVAADNLGIPFISVPTAASHDGIVSSRASIPDGDKRHSFEVRPPMSVVSDTSILSNAPFKLTASGCADIIANYTAVKDWKLADRLGKDKYNLYAGELSRACAEMIRENIDILKPKSQKGASVVVESLLCSGIAMSLEGSSRPASGSEHLFSHALDTIDSKRALHGQQCGVGSIISMYLHGGDWISIKKALKEINAPVNCKDLGFSGDEILEALKMAKELRPERYTIFQEKNGEEMKEAAEETEVIY